MAKVYLGSTQLKKAYIGSTAIKKIYRGSTLIWSGYQDETLAQKARIEADGGTIIDLEWIDLVISTLKTLGIYSNAKLLNHADFAVKKDITGAVSKLYDISGNNNDAVQTTGASQPIWSLVNGNGVITYDGSNDFLNCANSASLNITDAISIIIKINFKHLTTIQRIISKNYSTAYEMRVLTTNKVDVLLALSPYISLATAVALTPENMCSVTATYDKNGVGNNYKIYMNDNLSNSNISSIAIGTNNGILTIGAYQGGGSSYSSGQINSSTIFNIALTQDQITTLYSLGL